MRYRFIDKVVLLALDGRPRIEVEKTFHGDDEGVALRAVADLTGASPIGDDASVAEASTAVYAGETCLAAGTLLFLCVRVPGVDLAAWEASL